MPRPLFLLILLLLLMGEMMAQSKAERYFLQGRSKFDRGEYRAALKWLDKSIDLDTTITGAFVYRGAAELELFQLERSLQDLDRAISEDTLLHFAWYSRGRLYSRMFQYEKALHDLGKAIGMKPDRPIYIYAKALTLHAAGRAEDALLEFEHVIAMDSLFYRAYRERGTIFAQNGDTAKARIDLDKAIALAPKDPVSYNSRGFHLKAAYGHHQGALDDFNKAIKINPNYAYAFNNRGFSRYKTGELKKGLKDIYLSLKKRGDNAWAYRNLAVINLELGNKNEACRNASKAIEMEFSEQFGDAMQLLKKEHCNKSKNRPRPRNAP